MFSRPSISLSVQILLYSSPGSRTEDSVEGTATGRTHWLKNSVEHEPGQIWNKSECSGVSAEAFAVTIFRRTRNIYYSKYVLRSNRLASISATAKFFTVSDNTDVSSNNKTTQAPSLQTYNREQILGNVGAKSRDGRSQPLSCFDCGKTEYRRIDTSQSRTHMTTVSSGERDNSKRRVVMLTVWTHYPDLRKLRLR